MAETRNSSSKGSQGFTILEIVVVVALMGLLAAIAGPRIGSGLRGTESKTSVRKFAAALRAARMIAVAQKAQVLVIAELGSNQCEFRIRPVGKRRGRGSAGGINQAETGAGSGRDTSIPEIFQEPLELTGEVQFINFFHEQTIGNSDRGAVMFLPHGNSTGGRFILGREDGPFHEVVIDAVTGRVHTNWVE